jgi:hypothetical protein
MFAMLGTLVIDATLVLVEMLASRDGRARRRCAGGTHADAPLFTDTGQIFSAETNAHPDGLQSTAYCGNAPRGIQHRTAHGGDGYGSPDRGLSTTAQPMLPALSSQDYRSVVGHQRYPVSKNGGIQH